VTGLTILFVVLGITLIVPLYAFGVRRLLGLRLSPLRALIGGIVALACASPIITAIGGSIAKHNGKWPFLPALWFVILGVAIALLVGMLVVVIFEALVPSGTMPGPLYLIRTLRKRTRRVRRYSQISRILLRRGMLPYLRGARRAELQTSDGRVQLARSLRLALEDGGVTFIKLGQLLATRRDLLPVEFIDELSGLQDDAAQVPWPQIESMLRSELGGGFDDVFQSFDRTVLAAASIAQVHAATLSSGERVVVKVRRPGIDTVVAWDLDIVDRLARRLQRSTRWGRGVGAVDLSNGFAAALREELNLRIEAQNMTAVAAAAAARGVPGSVRIPELNQPLCTANVLVMERLDGRALGAITPAEQIGDRQALARTLFDTLLGEVMIDGIFHADPHPGNVLLLSDSQLGLLDFGSVGRIDAGLRAALQRLLLAVDRGDPAALNDALLEIVRRPDELDEPALERTLGQFMARHVGAGITPDVRMFTDLFRIVAEHQLSVPPEIAGAFRALATIEGTLTQLAPGFDILAQARRFTTEYLAEQLTPDALRQTATDELITLIPMLRRLPRRLDRITGSLEHGRLGLNIRLLADQSDRRYLTGLVHQLVLTFLAATLGVMSVLMLGLHGGPRVTHTITLYAFIGYCLLVFAGVLALRVLVLVFRPDAD
jgi:ubiquinone biosynthesis protein